MALLFTIAIFVCAWLLFFVQPMAAKLALPILGGSPAVWNTAMVFFQVLLLAGYGYAHLLNKLPPLRALLAHAGVVAMSFLLLDPARPDAPSVPDGTLGVIGWELGFLLGAVGGPFFVLASASPLLQAWFARSGHRRARDPYFLYAASNAGSLLALLLYPLAVERTLDLPAQGRAWTWMYAAGAALVLACGLRVLKRRRGAHEPESPDRSAASGGNTPDEVRWARRGRWVLLAFIPSSLMLGVTQYISTDLAAVPLLWVVPLAIYLLTFIFAFSPHLRLPVAVLALGVKLVLVAQLVAFLGHAREPLELLLVLNLLTLGLVAMLAHRLLAIARPGASRVTEFYLYVSLGGALGGVFNALLAPLVFDAVLEYPLVLALSALLIARPIASSSESSQRPRWQRALGALPWPGAPAGDSFWRRTLDAVLWPGLILLWLVWGQQSGFGRGAEMSPARGVFLAVPVLVAYLCTRHAARFALACAVVMVGSMLVTRQNTGTLLHAERTFFGTHEVYRSRSGRLHLLMHGTTSHGEQWLDPELAPRPITYYHDTGPIGDVFTLLDGDPSGRALASRVGLIGLGTGSLAAYSVPGDRYTYYEIDPEVARIASDPRFFTYLRDARGQIDIQIGDGRLELQHAEDGSLGVLVLDAFSSDAIPTHLLTVEAFELYRRKLAPGGVLAVHITNRHLDLEPVVAGASEALGWPGAVRLDTDVPVEERMLHKRASSWCVLSDTAPAVTTLVNTGQWTPLRDGQAWTDDRASILSVLRR